MGMHVYVRVFLFCTVWRNHTKTPRVFENLWDILLLWLGRRERNRFIHSFCWWWMEVNWSSCPCSLVFVVMLESVFHWRSCVGETFEVATAAFLNHRVASQKRLGFAPTGTPLMKKCVHPCRGMISSVASPIQFGFYRGGNPDCHSSIR